MWGPQSPPGRWPTLHPGEAMSSREFELKVPPGASRDRLDSYLVRHVRNATRSKIQQAVRDGYVRVDGRIVRSSHRITPGEVISVTLPSPPPPSVEAEVSGDRPRMPPPLAR